MGDFRRQMYGHNKCPFTGVTSYGKVCRKGAGKRGLKCELNQATACSLKRHGTAQAFRSC